MEVAMCWKDKRDPLMERQMQQKDMEIANLKKEIANLKKEIEEFKEKIRRREKSERDNPKHFPKSWGY